MTTMYDVYQQQLPIPKDKRTEVLGYDKDNIEILHTIYNYIPNFVKIGRVEATDIKDAYTKARMFPCFKTSRRNSLQYFPVLEELVWSIEANDYIIKDTRT